ncbi:hypothetical protein [Fibrobacter sp.]
MIDSKKMEKKEYTTPEMRVVELKHETNLMQASCVGVGCGDYPGGLN